MKYGKFQVTGYSASDFYISQICESDLEARSLCYDLGVDPIKSIEKIEVKKFA